MKTVPDPDPAGQKSTDPTGNGNSSASDESLNSTFNLHSVHDVLFKIKSFRNLILDKI